MLIPVKPFDDFKWRWLSFTPTEGLLVPPVFLGVLRAIGENDGCSTSDNGLLEALGKVQQETGTGIDLVRSPDRNLIRNAGQYWKGTGLIREAQGRVELSSLGWRVANSELSQAGFAALIIQQTTLPNRMTYDYELCQKWDDAGLQIKPFILILKLMVIMGHEYGHSEAYLTVNELAKIVVPLSGMNTQLKDYLPYIHAFREENLDLSGWPDCTPEANDRRMAREFLYFLRNFGVCEELEDGGKDNNKFALVDTPEINDLSELDGAIGGTSLESDEQAEEALDQVLQSTLPEIIERQRRVATILYRPGQAQFRKQVLREFGRACLITGDTVPDVLEAAHIVPISAGGSDNLDNGLCLRTDIHRLYDSQQLRVEADGAIRLVRRVSNSPGYRSLPSSIDVPQHINTKNIEWRNRYC